MANVDVTRIAGNIGALNALNSLQNINKQLALHQSRLSTGKRINSAADDPAGLTIATKMLARSEGMKVAVDNISDASNLLSVAEGGLSKMNDILVQMRNKAEQAASDTLGATERQAIQTQLSSYAEQIDNIVNETKWNGTKLLDGTVSKQFQTGVDNGESTTWSLAQSHSASSLDISKVSIGAATLQGNVGTVGAANTNAWDSTSGVVNLLGAGPTNGLSAVSTGRYQLNVLDVATGGTAGVAANAKFSVTNDGSTQGTLTKNAAGTNPTAELASGSGYTFAVTNVSGPETGQTVNFQITDNNGNNVATGSTVLADGVTSVLSGSTGLVGSLGISLAKVDGTTLGIGDNFTFDYLRGGDAKVNLTDVSGIAQTIDSDGLATGTTSGKAAYVTLAAAASTVVNTGRGVSVTMGKFSTAAANNYYKFDWEAAGNNTINVSTATLASSYMDKVTTAMDTVNRSMSSLGSLMARMDFKSEAVSTAQINVEASYNRIMNANMAEEQMNASKYSILQQTGVAMLAQANQAPQSLLSLFR